MMEYGLLKFLHILGAVLMGSGLIGVWMADLRSRQLRELAPFAEAVRNIAVFYDGFVVPGALLLLASGSWFVVTFYGGWSFLHIPWLAGMIGLFAFEFTEGNTVTRLYFMRLRPHSSPHSACGTNQQKSPLCASISANRCISGRSRCSGMFGISP